MNKPSKFALALAFAAFTATGVASAQTVDNWKNGDGTLVWKNGDSTLCWRDANWTPATAAPGCDGAVAEAKPAGKGLENNKVVFNADAFFDFDKAILKPEGKKLLDQVAAQAGTINL